MKILYLVPYLHDDEFSPYKRFGTGLSFTVASIISKSGELGHDVYVYAQSAFSPGFERGNVKYLPKKLHSVFPIKPRYLKAYRKDTKGCRLGLKLRLHVLSYYLFGGYVERVIDKVKPDVVSVRGIGYITRPMILACERKNVKYVVSLHGVNALRGANLTEREDEMEYDVFRNACEKGRPATVISSGIKRRMLSKLSLPDTPNVYVVSNGIGDIPPSDPSEAEKIRQKFGVTSEDRVIICASSINENKNQMQLLRAFHLLPEEEKSTVKLLFCGKGAKYDELVSAIAELGERDRVFACGFVPNTELGNYYEISDLNALVSRDEGFGRSFVEGFLHGVPALTFSDLDAIPDIYDPEVMVKVDERTDEALAEGIRTALAGHWDRNVIKAHGGKFSVDAMVKKYVAVYEKAIDS